MTSRLITTQELIDMLHSCREAKSFTITRDQDTCRVVHIETGEVVLEALAKTVRGPWIARIHPELFSEP